MKPISKRNLQNAVLEWFKQHGRKSLPWQQFETPYHVWVSEIMLQQTQVKTVIPYYERFITRFPTLEALANAPMDTVLQYWAGLGYYARARHLHQAAQIILSKYKGVFPNLFEEIISLPGIGRSTAGAILSFGFHKAYPILDGNIKRLLARVEGIKGYLGTANILKQLWAVAENYIPTTDVAAYNQAMMDIGALICTKEKPNCNQCPLYRLCYTCQNHLQNQIPPFNPQRKKPLKKAFFLMHSHQGKILLEKRPPKGIWGGLWSFPELIAEKNLSIKDTAKEWFKKNNFSFRIQSCVAWPPFTHAFTHFELAITPIQCLIASQRKTRLPPHLNWFQLEETASLGVPSPSRKLIKQLQGL